MIQHIVEKSSHQERQEFDAPTDSTGQITSKIELSHEQINPKPRENQAKKQNETSLTSQMEAKDFNDINSLPYKKSFN